jgi:activator of 2-hydroxyglutaryl-CoA dehydratase
MFEKELSASENLFFNGIYQVTKVDSRFQNGEFTQVLYCVRMNNQKGKGTPAVTGDLKELVEKANEQDKKKIDAAAKINENVSSKVAYSEAEWNNTSASGEFEKKYNERLKKKKEEGVTVTYEGGATTKETHPILDENGKVIGHSWTKTTGGGVKTTTVNKNWRDLEKVKK